MCRNTVWWKKEYISYISYSKKQARKEKFLNFFLFYRGINLQHGELSLVYVLDVFLQRASSRSPVQIVNVIARAGPIYADERQRYAKNGGVHGVDQRLDILFRDELLLDRRLRPSFQFARWYVAAGYLNLIRILELLPCNQSIFLFLFLFFFFSPSPDYKSGSAWRNAYARS